MFDLGQVSALLQALLLGPSETHPSAGDGNGAWAQEEAGLAVMRKSAEKPSKCSSSAGALWDSARGLREGEGAVGWGGPAGWAVQGATGAGWGDPDPDPHGPGAKATVGQAGAPFFTGSQTESSRTPQYGQPNHFFSPGVSSVGSLL